MKPLSNQAKSSYHHSTLIQASPLTNFTKEGGQTSATNAAVILAATARVHRRRTSRQVSCRLSMFLRRNANATNTLSNDNITADRHT